MKRFILFLLLLTGCVRDIRIERPVDRDVVAQNFDLALNGVAALLSSDGESFCSGVFHQDYVITANHCVDDGTLFRIAYRKDFDYELNRWEEHTWYEKVAFDDPGDVAILRTTDATKKGYRNTAISESGAVLGSRVFVFGHPYHLPYSITEGRVSAARRYYAPGKMLWTQISAQVSPGNSGGPVLNDDGEIVGIVSFRVSDAHLAGAAHLDTVLILLHSL